MIKIWVRAFPEGKFSAESQPSVSCSAFPEGGVTAGLHRAGLTTIGNFSVRPTVEESEGTSGIFSRIATEMTGITGAIGC